MDLGLIDVYLRSRSSVDGRGGDSVMPFSYLMMLVFLGASSAKLKLSLASCGH